MYYRRCMVPTSYRNGAIHIQPPEGGNPMRLEGTGRRIWELLEYPTTIEDLARRLASEFLDDVETIAGDTGRFLEALLERGLAETPGVVLSPDDRQRFRYLSLLKRSLVNLTYPEHELRIRFLDKQKIEMDKLEKKRYLRDIRYREPELYIAILDMKHGNGFSAQLSYRFSHTMIGMSALDNLERCAEQVFSEDIPGDFMEAGVCQGGAAIFMRALQVSHGQEKRRLWAADSFQGLPKPLSQPDMDLGRDFSEPCTPVLAFSLEGVRDNFLRYGLLDEGVVFLPGWFAETLPALRVEKLAILRLDADYYESTKVALENLYPRVVPGGFVIIDDYGSFPSCRKAVDEYRHRQGIADPVHFANSTVAYWRKQT